jgi:hypothetical protein
MNNEKANDYFGLCPVCKKPGICRNIGRDHWFACDEHRIRWWEGSNLFSRWRDEDPSVWEENARLLETYTETEAYRWPVVCSQCQREEEDAKARSGCGWDFRGDINLCPHCRQEWPEEDIPF